MAAWKDVLLRMLSEFSADRIPLVAAGAAFYTLLALVPSLAALVSIYGLAFDTQSVAQQMAMLDNLVPAEVQSILAEQLTRLTSEPNHSLGIAFVISLAMSIWSASSATKGIIGGLNVVYDEREKRSFIELNGTALAITISGLIVVTSLAAVTIALPIAIELIGLPPVMATAISYAGLIILVWLGLIALYRWGPSRSRAQWTWLAPGTCLAVVALIVFSIAFSWFARTFAGYAAYGSIGAVISFMTWCWIGMMILLLGAELNAELEHQTARDTTVGRPKPLGLRGANMADSVAPRDGVEPPPTKVGAPALPLAFAGFVAGVTLAAVLTRR